MEEFIFGNKYLYGEIKIYSQVQNFIIPKQNLIDIEIFIYNIDISDIVG